VGEDVNVGRIPIHELPVHPDLLRLLDHGLLSSFSELRAVER
jgi:hypothetical protein